MNERKFDLSDPDEEFAAARERLKQTLTDEDLAAIGNKQGMLRVADLPKDVRASDDFRNVVRQYDWPTMLEDGTISLPRQFSSDEEFLRALMPYSRLSVGETPNELPGPHSVVSSYLFRLLEVPAISSVTDAKSGNGIYGLLPAKHRAEVVSPELFKSLQIVLPKLRDRYPFTEHVADDETYGRDNLAEYLRSDAGHDVLEAMRLAHQIIGRLVKTDEYDRLREATGMKGSLQPIGHADDIVFNEPS